MGRGGVFRSGVHDTCQQVASPAAVNSVAVPRRNPGFLSREQFPQSRGPFTKISPKA
jgi:hypothetical protein